MCGSHIERFPVQVYGRHAKDCRSPDLNPIARRPIAQRTRLLHCMHRVHCAATPTPATPDKVDNAARWLGGIVAALWRHAGIVGGIVAAWRHRRHRRHCGGIANLAQCCAAYITHCIVFPLVELAAPNAHAQKHWGIQSSTSALGHWLNPYKIWQKSTFPMARVR